MLNEAQLRHLSTVMRVVEKRLMDLQQQLNTGAPKSTLIELEDDLSDAERAFVAEKTTELLEVIADVAQHFRLSSEWRSLRRAMVASLSITWADLRDANTTAMRSYGETDPRLPESLDPLIERLCEGALEILRRLRSNKKEGEP